MVTHGPHAKDGAVGRYGDQQVNGAGVAIGRNGLEHDRDGFAVEAGAVRGDGFRCTQQLRIAQGHGVGQQVVVVRPAGQHLVETGQLVRTFRCRNLVARRFVHDGHEPEGGHRCSCQHHDSAYGATHGLLRVAGHKFSARCNGR